jgi:hypothetical protein
MSLWLAGSLFFGGALTHMVVSYYLNVHQSGKFVKEVTEQMLTFMTILAWDFSNALKMKYEALGESDLSDEEIVKIFEIDKRMYETWKRSIIAKAFPSFPREHVKMLPTFDWDGALTSLDNIYYKPQNDEEPNNE